MSLTSTVSVTKPHNVQDAISSAARLDALLNALSLPSRLPELPESDLIAAMGMDKKNAGQVLRIILLKGIGACRVYETTPGFFAGMSSFAG